MSHDSPPGAADGDETAPSDPHPRAKLRLKVTGGPVAGKELTVEDELVIGREASEEGRLGDDVEISRQHARITRTSLGEWTIEDLGSRNGTFVNGHRIDQRELLAAGDAIEVGSTRLVVQVSAPTTPPGPQAAPQFQPTRVGDAVPPVAPPAIEEAGPSDSAPQPVEPEPDSVEPEPAPEPEPTAATGVPPVSVRLDLDLAAGEAHISLEDGSDRVRLVLENGAWRLRPEP